MANNEIFDRKFLNNETIVKQKLDLLTPSLEKAGVVVSPKALQNTITKIAGMDLKGEMDNKTLDRFLMMTLMMELKPEMGNSLSNAAFNQEMNRIKQLLDLDKPGSKEDLQSEILSLLKTSKAAENIPAPDLESIAARMAEKLYKPKPEPSNQNENDDEEKKEKLDEDEDENKLSLKDRANLMLMGYAIGKESKEFSADLTKNIEGNQMGAVSQNPEKSSGSFLDLLYKVISFKEEPKKELDHSPLPTRPKPPGVS